VPPVSAVQVIIPTYNECENIDSLVRMLLALPVDVNVIVVDDNSPDGTGKCADQLAEEYPGRVRAIHRAGKLGLGTAYLAGYREAFTLAPDYIITMDADFSHHPRYIPSMVEKADTGFDLVIGSRYVPGGDTPDFPWYRRLLSWGANTFAHLLLGLRARDATAGFRCYRREVLETLPIESIKSSGYSFLIEMLFLVQNAGYRVGEVPIIFEDRKLGQSKISQQEIVRALNTVFQLFFRRLFG
jgi:glycosyltransferase involved in cell wall biosynthesis